MGRSFQSVRMGVNDLAGRWGRAARAMRSEDSPHADRVVAMAKTYASEAFYAFDDPLEAAFFSVLICMCRECGPDDRPAVTSGDTIFSEAAPRHKAEIPSREPGNGLV
jgi:hypothetical protein